MKSETTIDLVFRKEGSQMGRSYISGASAVLQLCIVYVLLWADRTPKVLPTSSWDILSHLYPTLSSPVIHLPFLL